jgi:hypothetical protein
MVYFKRGPFKEMDFPKRLDILTRFTELLTDPCLKRVYAAIDTTKLFAKEKAAEFAFAHFCERVQMAIPPGEYTILIGDYERDEFKQMIGDFAQYRSNGTPWQYGIEITKIVDSVHFARSHHSRMIQLADMWLFVASHWYGSRKGGMAEAFTAAMKGKELWPHRYKFWPNF